MTRSDSGGISGLIVLEFPTHRDSRGSFQKVFSKLILATRGEDLDLKQVNYSRNSEVGTLRGLHYQLGAEKESKVIHCLQGGIMDIVLDIREDSPTFMKWESFELKEDQSSVLKIPAGCAHGFQTLTAETIVLYLHTAEYLEEAQSGINAMDPQLGIHWPITPAIRSKKDELLPFLTDDWKGVKV